MADMQPSKKHANFKQHRLVCSLADAIQIKYEKRKITIYLFNLNTKNLPCYYIVPQATSGEHTHFNLEIILFSNRIDLKHFVHSLIR